MNNLGKSFCLSLIWLGLLSLRGSAQDNPPPPDPSHVVFLAPDKVKWEGTGGQRHMNLVGDPSKPGLYVRLAEWLPLLMPHRQALLQENDPHRRLQRLIEHLPEFQQA